MSDERFRIPGRCAVYGARMIYGRASFCGLWLIVCCLEKLLVVISQGMFMEIWIILDSFREVVNSRVTRNFWWHSNRCNDINKGSPAWKSGFLLTLWMLVHSDLSQCRFLNVPDEFNEIKVNSINILLQEVIFIVRKKLKYNIVNENCWRIFWLYCIRYFYKCILWNASSNKYERLEQFIQ